MLEYSRELLQSFEDGLDPVHPANGIVPAKIIGYGEMSTVLHIGPYQNLVFKRMSGYDSTEQMSAYREVIEQYRALLRECGIHTAETDFAEITNRRGEHTLYLVQEKVHHHHLGDQRLANLDGDAFQQLLRDTLATLDKLWSRNAERGPGELLGLDGQLSNWAFKEEAGRFRLTYFDIGTPFIRKDGVEQLDGSVHMKAMPFFLRWIIRAMFYQQVMDRYYDFRSVLIDLIANIHKEGHQQKIDPAIETVNTWLAGPGAKHEMAPITRTEIDSYYREDAFIWTLFLNFRRFDRFLTNKILRRRYNYILPGKIRR